MDDSLFQHRTLLAELAIWDPTQHEHTLRTATGGTVFRFVGQLPNETVLIIGQ